MKKNAERSERALKRLGNKMIIMMRIWYYVLEIKNL